MFCFERNRLLERIEARTQLTGSTGSTYQYSHATILRWAGIQWRLRESLEVDDFVPNPKWGTPELDYIKMLTRMYLHKRQSKEMASLIDAQRNKRWHQLDWRRSCCTVCILVQGWDSSFALKFYSGTGTKVSTSRMNGRNLCCEETKVRVLVNDDLGWNNLKTSGGTTCLEWIGISWGGPDSSDAIRFSLVEDTMLHRRLIPRLDRMCHPEWIEVRGTVLGRCVRELFTKIGRGIHTLQG
jgi:hypothetical protein